MHTLKLVVLVLLTVAVMRLASWLIGWLLSRLFKRNSVFLLFSASLLAFGCFVVFLMVNRIPGEFLDFEALTFGAIVFGICFATDLKWCPWSGDRHLER